jgi:hypothetical protein
MIAAAAAAAAIVMGFYVRHLFGLFIIIYNVYGQIFTYRNYVAFFG